MRLLPRRELDIKKSEERQREINEGSKLARTIDSLRELRSEEETKFTEWRNQTLKGIQNEIDQKSSELSLLTIKVEKLELRKKAAEKSLDDEWDKAYTQKARNEEKSNQLIQEKSELRLAVASNIQRERENEVETGRIAEERKRTTQELVASAKDHEQAKNEVKRAQERTEVMNAALALREKEVSEREQKSSDMVWKAEQLMKKIQIYEGELADREATLRSGWKSLENTKKNL